MTTNSRNFNTAELNGGAVAFLEKDGTGRWVWTTGIRETLLGCYEKKSDARAEMLKDERFGRILENTD